MRQYFGLATSYGDKFQFTHPVWGATSEQITANKEMRFNSRTPCGVRRVGVIGVVQDDGVSIHAPRVGCDEDELED